MSTVQLLRGVTWMEEELARLRKSKQEGSMTQNALERGRTAEPIPSDYLTAKDNRAKAKLLLARQAALGAGQLFQNLPLSMQRNYMTLSENMLATIERLARVTW